MKNIEKIVTDLETSKQLQEAGIKRDTVWVWVEVSITEKKEIPVLARNMTLTSDCMVSKKGTKWILQYNNSYSNNKIIPAFTAGELMQVLPDVITKNAMVHYLILSKDDDKFYANYLNEDAFHYLFDYQVLLCKLPHQALAKLCLWCKKEGYL